MPQINLAMLIIYLYVRDRSEDLIRPAKIKSPFVLE